ncbi:MAG: molybdopterin-synthase adenylyltransferase MoeB [Thermoanaerobaculia bacterium]|nr:molybdopterin-synthase adenylyltransferase MoeB [Thermoanaerobaculia bacterium]
MLTGVAELPALSREELIRYGRHLVIPEVGEAGQRRLKASRVLLAGAGGLGSPLALYLAAAGVGRLGIVEYDRVDASNLQRQLLYGNDDVGRPKLEVARERLGEINPHVEIVSHPRRLAAENADEILAGYEVVADGTDNFAARYLINDACVKLGIPDVYGSIFRFEGQVSVFGMEEGPCYRCLFPEPPPPGLVPSCAEAGVLGILPGIIGSLQANEVVKVLLGIGEPMVGRFLVFDALSMRFREVTLARNPECPVCSLPREEIELPDYEEHCDPSVEVASESPEPDASYPTRITVEELARWREEGRELDLLDVREPFEHRIAALEGAELVPMGRLPDRMEELEADSDRPLVVYCHHGIRSARAVEYLRSQGCERAVNLAEGIDAWSRRIDPEVPRY